MENNGYANEINCNQIRSEKQWIELLIPSFDVKQHLLEINHEFTDSEKASLVISSEFDFENKQKLLLDISSSTSDESLKNKIECYIDSESKRLSTFKENSLSELKYIYEISIMKESDEVHTEYALEYDKAFEYGLRNDSEFIIRKKKMIVDEESIDCYLNKINSINYIRYSKDGKIQYYSIIDDTMEFVKSYAEEWVLSSFVDIPIPFEAGDLVKVSNTGEIGVIALSQEWSKKLENPLLNRAYRNNRILLDFVFQDCEDSSLDFYDDRVDPRYLEKANVYEMKMQEHNQKNKLLIAASELRKGKITIRTFQREFLDYYKGGSENYDF